MRNPLDPLGPPPDDNAVMDALSAEQQVVLDALDDVFAPMAQLCIARGIRIQAVEDQLRGAFVKAAHDAHPAQSSNRQTSRISATTGLTRREVARLESQPDRSHEPRRSTRSPITELFTRWLTDPALHDADGKPLQLPRHGLAPSFESLAHAVTRDVHPRTLLDELCRLQLAAHDTASDSVRLLREAFVPRGDWARMLVFLGDNVGDHFRAAVANVLQDGKQHIEQAIFADELSAESLAQARELMAHQWRALLEQVAPQLEHLIDRDRESGRAQDQSLRIGLFTWSQTMAAPAASSIPPTPKESTS
ncbi:DUF6502 family protein [Polaromonas sp.]|uniref:DUF6502 family protein n=1 Tax=Polaromonas sp. TaxID=1869339 RepID=UPI00286C6EEB|nr:DUF6502 family protein [Polaromonas sp.]